MCADGLQVILTTHSPAFIDILNLEGIVLVRKDENGATYARQLTREDLAEYCINHGANPSRTSVDSILPFYAAHATEEILSGFFAKAVVLVEGGHCNYSSDGEGQFGKVVAVVYSLWNSSLCNL